jgi:hypothetical protein
MNIIPANVSPDIAALIDVERRRIEDLYGVETAQAVAHIMHGILMSVFLYAEHNDMSATNLMHALSDSITAINRLSKEYTEKSSKAELN